jgi:pseudouridine-5'-monophosphatase
VFEDAPAGVQAALAAEMRVCWVPDPNVDRADIAAHQVLDSLADFAPEFWGLLPFSTSS